MKAPGMLSEGQIAEVGEAMGQISAIGRDVDQVLSVLMSCKVSVSEKAQLCLHECLNKLHDELCGIVAAHVDAINTQH